jgi:hypothetical protein
VRRPLRHVWVPVVNLSFMTLHKLSSSSLTKQIKGKNMQSLPCIRRFLGAAAKLFIVTLVGYLYHTSISGNI